MLTVLNDMSHSRDPVGRGKEMSSIVSQPALLMSACQRKFSVSNRFRLFQELFPVAGQVGLMTIMLTDLVPITVGGRHCMFQRLSLRNEKKIEAGCTSSTPFSNPFVIQYSVLRFVISSPCVSDHRSASKEDNIKY